jgi:hypothetical protein
VITGSNGVFTIPNFLVTGLSFTLTATTNMAASSYGSFYEDSNATYTFNAAPGKIEPIIWFDHPITQGYLVGENFTVLWNLSGVGDIANQNILAWIVLYDYDNPNVELRKAIVPLYKPVKSNATIVADGSWNFTQFILPHDRLMVRIVIDGRDLNNSFAVTYTSSWADAETFVYLNNSRPVQVAGDNISGIFTNATVGINYKFVIPVAERLAGAQVINSGFLNITFDGIYTFIVPVVNGNAIFNHTFSKAVANRLVEVRYIANPEANLSASAKVKTVFQTLKGTPALTVIQLPNPTVSLVGQPVTIQVLINGFAAAAAAAPKNLTLNFISSGKIVHSTVVPITASPNLALADGTSVFATIASATFEYAYKLPHNALVIKAVLTDPNENYNTVSGNWTVFVV